VNVPGRYQCHQLTQDSNCPPGYEPKPDFNFLCQGKKKLKLQVCTQNDTAYAYIERKSFHLKCSFALVQTETSVLPDCIPVLQLKFALTKLEATDAMGHQIQRTMITMITQV